LAARRLSSVTARQHHHGDPSAANMPGHLLRKKKPISFKNLFGAAGFLCISLFRSILPHRKIFAKAAKRCHVKADRPLGCTGVTLAQTPTTARENENFSLIFSAPALTFFADL
jgi:hypothetical protein